MPPPSHAADEAASATHDVNTASQQTSTSRFLREIVHSRDAPPPIAIGYFYTSPLAIDDPLSPLPPPASSSSTTYKQPPRPFSSFDNAALDRAWLDLRSKIQQYNDEGKSEKAGGVRRWGSTKRPSVGSNGNSPVSQRSRANSRETSAVAIKRRSELGTSRGPHPLSDHMDIGEGAAGSNAGSFKERSRCTGSEMKVGSVTTAAEGSGSLGTSLKASDLAEALFESGSHGNTTGTPFIRAPSRKDVTAGLKVRPAFPPQNDSYDWDDDSSVPESPSKAKSAKLPKLDRTSSETDAPSARVPVGVSRLHEVVMDDNPVRMEPIYWKPVNDISAVIRGTWFYKDTMLPVEVEVAHMLEAGYVGLRPWSQTWKDELDSAVDVGAAGEEKIVHRLWPDTSRNSTSTPNSRPGTSAGGHTANFQINVGEDLDSPEKKRGEILQMARDVIDLSTGSLGYDNKACGSAPYGRDGKQRLYLDAGVIYANAKDAYLLRPNLSPSDYYGRRPLANYIRKGRAIGIGVVRGFDADAWNKIYPPKKGAMMAKASEGVSSAQAGVPTVGRQKLDPSLALSERPEVTDLVLIIHGIGQKLSERMESFHFTHAINSFRREINVELGENAVKAHLRPDGGGIMALPVNWRLGLSFEDGGYRDEAEEAAPTQYTLNDITPDTLPTVRNIVSDVMLDVPYYLSNEHSPKMVTAVINEANRVYRLWCANNPGFSEWGRVHLIGHSLGSVMAIDILSKQPSRVPPHLGDPKIPAAELPTDQLLFDTKSLFLCGSPVGFFLLLKKSRLLPRKDRDKPGSDSSSLPGVSGEQNMYGCLAVDNVYNIINPYDPVCYRLNATVDKEYSAILKKTYIPSSASSLFSLRNPFKSTSADVPYGARSKPKTPRLPSTVELETHDFSREEIAEKKAFLLNDNGQIDYFMRYGGGPLDIQYLTMLGAHSSYWLSRDFTRMIVVEVGRRFGKEGTVPAMRAQKKKIVVNGG